jgi:uncharacterized repeat protein (TIGR01451 family)
MTGPGGERSRRDRQVIGWRLIPASRSLPRRCALPVLVVLLALAAAGVAAATTGRAAQLVPPDPTVLGPQDHIHVCHAEGNGAYHLVDPDIDSVVHGHGHGGHPSDIIPPFNYDLGHGAGVQRYPGNNWNAATGNADGEAIWTNTCVRPAPPGRIDVFVSCVDVHGPTYDATFGYVSGNAGDLTIPIGANNRFTTGNEDRGQPTVFGPGLHLANFTVTGIPSGQTLAWEVTSGGIPSKAEVSASFDRPCTEPPNPQPDFPIGVFVTCVVSHGSTYDAIFGYESENADSETIPVGEANFFAPGHQNRGQPETFAPGRHEDALTVTGIPSTEDLTWTLVWADTRSITATANFEPKCEGSAGGTPTPLPPPPPPPPPAPPPLPIGVFAACVTNHGPHYDAAFGYVNENAEVVSIPIGSHNAISPGTVGQGQPESFHPGFLEGAFTVRGVSASHAVTWTVRFGDQTRVATATADFAHKCLTAPIDPVANAAIRKTATPSSVMVGGRVRFTIVVRNTGSEVLRPVRVSDTLPATQLRILSATSTLRRCRVTTAGGSRRVHCSARTLAPGQSFTVHITARATAAGSATDRATVAGIAHAVASATVHISGPPAPPFTG